MAAAADPFHPHNPFHFTEFIAPAELNPNGRPVLRNIHYGTERFEIGYDLSNVIGDVQRVNMQCSICLNFPRYPIELRRCGHVFCYLCVLRNISANMPRSYTEGAPCPICKTDYFVSGIIPFGRSSQALLNLYNSFDVRCVYNCGNVSSPRMMHEHENWQCPLRPVACINHGCGAVLTDQQMMAHLDTCPLRSVYCNSCCMPKLHNSTSHVCPTTTNDILRGMHVHKLIAYMLFYYGLYCFIHWTNLYLFLVEFVSTSHRIVRSMPRSQVTGVAGTLFYGFHQEDRRYMSLNVLPELDTDDRPARRARLGQHPV